MAILLDGSGKPIDATNPDNLNEKILDERETRKRLLAHARLAEIDRGVKGLEKEMMVLFAKIDKLMRTCNNDSERRDISALGAVEVYRILGGGGQLYVNNKLVCDDQKKD
jgi:hypothetical protein